MLTDVPLDLDDPDVRLTCKRIVALVRHCENRGVPFPKYRNISAALGIMQWELAKYVNLLISEEIIIRPREKERARFLRVNC